MPTPVPADPWSAGLMAAGSVATAALNDKTNMTNGVSSTFGFDNSGFAVNIAGKGATATQNADASKSNGLDLAALLKNPVVLVGLAVGLYLLLGRK